MAIESPNAITNGHAKARTGVAPLDVSLLLLRAWSAALTRKEYCQPSKLKITVTPSLKSIPPPETLKFGQVGYVRSKSREQGMHARQLIRLSRQ